MEQPKTLEELRKSMVSTFWSLAVEMGCGGDSWEDGRKEAEEEVAEFENAVRKDEQERIRKASVYIPEQIVDVRTFTCPPYPDNPMVTVTHGRYIIPASVLAPKEKP
jgi:hypothetical protein